jgi:hypothetical protein
MTANNSFRELHLFKDPKTRYSKYVYIDETGKKHACDAVSPRPRAEALEQNKTFVYMRTIQGKWHSSPRRTASDFGLL